ncbi:MAG: immunogenic protein precursor, partial [Proteobacteria bacterium]|nr:immunogenic protein precursor [Pseudomonadota bacterium]
MVSVGSWSFVMARPGLDEAVALRVAKALHAVEASPSRQLAETTAKNTLTAIGDQDLLHPGVRTYYRQAG